MCPQHSLATLPYLLFSETPYTSLQPPILPSTLATSFTENMERSFLKIQQADLSVFLHISQLPSQNWPLALHLGTESCCLLHKECVPAVTSFYFCIINFPICCITNIWTCCSLSYLKDTYIPLQLFPIPHYPLQWNCLYKVQRGSTHYSQAAAPPHPIPMDTPPWGSNKWLWDQESHVLPTEPARHPYLLYFS